MDRFIYKTSIKTILVISILFIISCGSETTIIPLPTCTVVDSITNDTIQIPTFDYSCL